jgi:beta-glucosidase-like glycosyl hydrolase
MAESELDMPYRNSALGVEERVNDLLGRMTVEEKAAMIFHDIIFVGPDGTLAGASPQFDMPSTKELIRQKQMTHFNLLGPITDAQATARWYNNVQREARKTRLGIPVTISSDPRNHFTDNVGTSFSAGIFSQWPEMLGLAALRSADLVERFAHVARQEYLAVGLRLALHPQVDLATEPRWARLNAGFGEDADLSSELVAAYIRGFQNGATLGKNSVSTMTKHFPGGGPQKDGEDPHFTYGREQIYPGNNFEYHLKPFKAAIAAGAQQIMPYYGMPVDMEYEEIGFAFNKAIITGLLREQMGFQGIVCTDWGLLTDKKILGQDMAARAWGLEHLDRSERLLRILDAGCDQLGGESCLELLVQLVETGQVPIERLDQSVRRLLNAKFLLGLFDNPFVDEEAAATIVGNSQFSALGNDAQRRSYTLLTNRHSCLPLDPTSNSTVADSRTLKVYVEGIPAEIVQARGMTVVETPENADMALLRLRTPFESRPGAFEALFHAGSLEFSPEEKARQARIYDVVPIVIVDIYADRPPVVPEIIDAATAVLISYGSTPDAFMDIVLGVSAPEGQLPFDLPSSMDAVRQSKSDTPYDTENPLFRFGHGLRYPTP